VARVKVPLLPPAGGRLGPRDMDARQFAEWTASTLQFRGNEPSGLAAYKTATDSRSSTTTYADDDELAVSLVGGAVYAVDFGLILYQAASTPDMKVQFAYSGSGNFRNINGTVNNPSGTFYFLGPQTSGVIFSANAGFPPFDPTGVWGTVLYETTTDGTFSVQWAQVASSANSVSMVQGSYMQTSRLILAE
jgi:hypothetical protein